MGTPQHPRIAAIIPARGGSKGIVRKNVTLLAGRPLISYTLEHALQSRVIDRVIVSTDASDVAVISSDQGAEVVRRPKEISDDDSPSEAALLHVLDHLPQSDGYEPDLIVFLQATSPMRQPDDIEMAVKTLENEGADSLFSGYSIQGFVWRSTDRSISPLSYDFRQRPRRQDAPEDFIENGSIYVFKPQVLRETGNRLGGRVAVYEMSFFDSFQVDEPADIEVMETLLTRRRTVGVPSFGAVGMLALDFDGVLTDNRVLVEEDGTEAILCDRSDGLGIAKLLEAGIEVIVLSTETNPVVAARCQKLGIRSIQGSDDKLVSLKRCVEEASFAPAEVAYMGNDENDLECLRWVGVPITVPDAHPTVLAVAAFVTTRKGGRGAVREVADLILGARER